MSSRKIFDTLKSNFIHVLLNWSVHSDFNLSDLMLTVCIATEQNVSEFLLAKSLSLH